MMEPLGRFYTSSHVSTLLVSRFRQTSPGSVLDLGVGSGSLLKAASERWKDAVFYAADIDKERIFNTSSNLSFATFRHIDGLSPSLPEKMNIKVGSIDVAICNPPYIRIERTCEVKHLMEEGGLPCSVNLKRITSDIVFLGQNLQMLKMKGELGIILPDGIFTSREFVDLRTDLLENHTVLGVIQLPDNIFKKTEARTHILLIEKGGETRENFPLYRANRFGYLDPVIYINPVEGRRRMDYSFYEWQCSRLPESTGIVKLKDIEAEIKRGRHTKKYLEELGVDYFHTTSFPCAPTEIILPDATYRNGINAETGDILMARVGKRCVGRTALVSTGSSVVTDCVYRIRVPEKFREAAWNTFVSTGGQDWLNAHAHGVCARCISKEDLLSFPVIL